MPDPLAARLAVLLREGSIAASRVTAAMSRRLEGLFEVGVLARRRRGAGWHVVVEDPVGLRAWIRSEYPSGLEGTDQDLPPRARGVADFGDSKRGGRVEAALLHARGFRGVELTREGTTLPLAEMTDRYGAATLVLRPERPWWFRGRLALIENAELFLHVEEVLSDIDVAIWYRGKLDGRILAWLGELDEVQVVLPGDYDPVGLGEYLRVREVVGERAVLYVPEDLEARVARYGNRRLLVKSAQRLSRVRREADAAVERVLEVLDRHGRGLEQENLLVERSGEE